MIRSVGDRVVFNRTGLQGRIVEVYTNAARVLWDNGTYWTALFKELV